VTVCEICKELTMDSITICNECRRDLEEDLSHEDDDIFNLSNEELGY